VSYVYLIQGGPYFKIGWSASDPGKRLRNLCTASPYPLTLVGWIDGTRADEDRLHKEYEAKHQHGEWFNLSPQDVAHILGGLPADQPAPSYDPALLRRLLSDCVAAWPGGRDVTSLALVKSLLSLRGAPWASRWEGHASVEALRDLWDMLASCGVFGTRVIKANGYGSTGYKLTDFTQHDPRSDFFRKRAGL
jgi:Meiotically up-regulated gene 113